MKNILQILMITLFAGCGGSDIETGANHSFETNSPVLTGIQKSNTPSTPKTNPILKSNLDMGINIHLDSGPRVRLMREMGVNWVRIDMNWSIMEPQPGQWNFQVFDDAIANARSLGMQVYASIGYTPSWASQSGKEPAVPNVDQWMNFVRVAVSRYKDHVGAFGIWNEPNLDGFWAGTADQYVDVLLKPACSVIRQIDPSIKIAGPELAHIYKATIDVGVFLNTLKNKGAFSCLDIITHHIYAAKDFEQKITGYSFFGIVYKPGIKQWFKNAGIWGRKVWITEFGQGIDDQDDAGQAKWVVENIRTLTKYNWIERAFIFEMTDDPRPSAPYHMGMTRADGSIRPVYYEVKRFIEENLSSPVQ